MTGQSFDFDTFQSQASATSEGLSDGISEFKQIIPAIQDVAAQIGSAKLTKTTDSAITVIEEMSACFDSVNESLEEVKQYYRKFNEATN